ncbi:MAG: 3-dehydroquinate dehydratase [Alphaproteobacteria bacterium]|nr:3-dehydroquinate dehydratase [Alphaproteobacteria bacterium]
MMKIIYILNGPNLNLLGTRQPDLYGKISLDDIRQNCHLLATEFGYKQDFRQTNHEGMLIDWVQEAAQKASGILINAGGLTHTSVSLLDALLTVTIPVIEVHLTIPCQRESFRHQSFVTPAAHGIVAGFGPNSYTLALRALVEKIEKQRA